MRARFVDGVAGMTLVIEENVSLSGLTTIGTGGPARLFARPSTLGELEEALRLAAERGLPVLTIGLGSNVLAADDGVEALVSCGSRVSWRRSRPTGRL